MEALKSHPWFTGVTPSDGDIRAELEKRSSAVEEENKAEREKKSKTKDQRTAVHIGNRRS